jgi:hypothetical protein
MIMALVPAFVAKVAGEAPLSRAVNYHQPGAYHWQGTPPRTRYVPEPMKTGSWLKDQIIVRE